LAGVDRRFPQFENRPLGGARRQKPKILSGVVSRQPVNPPSRHIGGSVDTIGLYARSEAPGKLSHKSSARGRESQIFRVARNILFNKSVPCRYYGSIEDIVRYRKPFLLGRKSSARGRWMLRLEKTSKIRFSTTVESLRLPFRGFVGALVLYNFPQPRGHQVHSSSARWRQIFLLF
jgi:hypothetical protein